MCEQCERYDEEVTPVVTAIANILNGKDSDVVHDALAHLVCAYILAAGDTYGEDIAATVAEDIAGAVAEGIERAAERRQLQQFSGTAH